MARIEDKDIEIDRLREALTSAYSMLSLMRYRTSAFDGSTGIPSVADADVVLAKCRAALKEDKDDRQET